MSYAPGALVERHEEEGLSCARCTKRARFLVTRHDTSGRTSSCAQHLDATMQSLAGRSPFQVGARARLHPWARIGTIHAHRMARDIAGRALPLAWIRWEDGDEGLVPISGLVPAYAEE